MSDFVILLSNFKFIFTWPLTFFDLEHLHNFISLGVVNIFHVFFPKLCCDCSATFDSKFPVPEVFLSKGHQELNCRGEETSSSINQVLFHNILRVHLNTQIHLVQHSYIPSTVLIIKDWTIPFVWENYSKLFARSKILSKPLDKVVCEGKHPGLGRPIPFYDFASSVKS